MTFQKKQFTHNPNEFMCGILAEKGILKKVLNDKL